MAKFNPNAKPFVPFVPSGDGSFGVGSTGVSCPSTGVSSGGVANNKNDVSGQNIESTNVDREVQAAGNGEPKPRTAPSQNQQKYGRGRRRKERSFSNDQDQSNHLANEMDLLELGIQDGRKNKRGEVSLSHLLEYAPLRNSQHTRERLASPPMRSSYRRNRGSTAIPIDSKTYINFSCRFVLDPSLISDTTNYLSNPDECIPLHFVQRVISRPQKCPICQDIAEAPRMIKCGHVFCLPCMYRFLDSEALSSSSSTSKSAPRECPICNDIVGRHPEVFAVTFHGQEGQLQENSTGNTEVELSLMFRPNSSKVAVPLESSARKDVFTSPPVVTDGLLLNTSCRFMLGSKTFAISQFENERRLLKDSMEVNKVMYEDDGTWYKKSLDEIGRNISALHGKPEIESPFQPEISVAEYATKFSDSSAYFFYQLASDFETKYFLSALDIKILRAEFGSYSAFPLKLQCKVERTVHGNSVTPELRKRIKYLSHLPLHTPVAFFECDWTGIVSSGVLSSFSKELLSRKKQWRMKSQRENRDSARIQRIEEERMRENIAFQGAYSLPAEGSRSRSDYFALTDEELPTLGAAPPKSIPNSSQKTVWGKQQNITFAEDAASPEDQQPLKPIGRKGKKYVLMTSGAYRG